MFDGRVFVETARGILEEAKAAAKRADVDILASLYSGQVLSSSDDRASSAKVYELNPSWESGLSPVVFLKPFSAYVWQKEAEQKIKKMTGREKDFCALMMRGGSVDNVQFPPRFLLRPSNINDTSARIRSLRAEGQGVIVASEGYPVIDFATSLYNWFNAKVGPSVPSVNIGAFITVMLDLGLAHKSQGKLVMNKEHNSANITLIMLRNNPTTNSDGKNYEWEATVGRNHKDMDLDQVKDVFVRHVDVKVLDVTKWKLPEYEDLDTRIPKLLAKFRIDDPYPKHPSRSQTPL